MASRHPLDVFRSSATGFEHATRRRRTIEGRVITSRARSDGPPEGDHDPDREAGDDAGAHAAAEPAPAAAREAAPASGASTTERSSTRATAGKGQRQPAARSRRKKRRRQGPERAGAASSTSSLAAARAARRPEPAEPPLAVDFDGPVGRVTGDTLSASEPLDEPRAALRVAPERRALSPPPFGVQRRGNAKALSQLMLYGSCLVVLALGAWVGVQHDWSAGDAALQQASAAEVLASGPGSAGTAPSLLAGGDWFTIQAASYNPSEKGQSLAWEAHDGLLARGYHDVLVTGDQLLDEQRRPVLDEQGLPRLTSCVLLVGRSRDRRGLESLLASLEAIDDWPTGAASPFEDARIIAHPNPDEAELHSDG